MTKSLIIGLATIAITGTALVASGLYAATGTGNMSSMGYIQRDPQSLIATLSGKVSPEALTALTTLMMQHQKEMDTMKSNTETTLDKTQMQAKKTAFKVEMDALLTKYPDLKAAMPAMKIGMGGKRGHGNREADAIIATLSVVTQAELTSIHDTYKAKEQALRTEEQSKIDAILIQFPDVKAKLNTLKVTQMQERKDREHHGGNDDNMTVTETVN